MIAKALKKTAYRLYAKRNPKMRNRRFIHPDLGVTGFFDALQDRDVRYVVLRWFDRLPEIDPGEDLDILVDDGDVEKIEDLLRGNALRGIPCDIYSKSGLPGTGYKSVSHYPVNIAERILDSAVYVGRNIRVPGSEAHFYSLAFHALYHKGFDSGLAPAPDIAPRKQEPEHDYSGTLARIADESGLVIDDFSMQGLDQALSKSGWRPSIDYLEKLSRGNKWISQYCLVDREIHDYKLYGVATYIIRERGVEYLDLIRGILQSEGLHILAEHEISADRIGAAIQDIRGGNWRKGPFPTSGGDPAYVFLVYDLFPVEPSESQKTRHPGLENSRILKIKNHIRDEINVRLSKTRTCNMIHSSDNLGQAVDYYRIVIDKPIESYIGSIEDYANICVPRFPVIKDLSKNSKRAKVELIDYHGERAVLKTFRPGAERFLRRELEARSVFGDLPEMSRILEHGPFYLIMEYYKNNRKLMMEHVLIGSPRKVFGNQYLERIIEILETIKSRGYDFIDFHLGSILFNEDDGIKLIDFEYLQKIPGSSYGLKGNYSWYSVPSSANCDIPGSGPRYYRHPYYKFWFRKTGLPLFLIVSMPWLRRSRLIKAITVALYIPYDKIRELFRRISENRPVRRYLRNLLYGIVKDGSTIVK